MELFETQIMVKKDKAEEIIREFNKDAEDDGVLDIDIFFDDDYEEKEE